jgi:protein FRA10AC1
VVGGAVLFYGGNDAVAAAVVQPVKTDHDTLRETYRFLRGDGDERGLKAWESALAKRYYDKVRTRAHCTWRKRAKA